MIPGGAFISALVDFARNRQKYTLKPKEGMGVDFYDDCCFAEDKNKIMESKTKRRNIQANAGNDDE